MGTIAKPYTFSPNTTASSSEVNANFDTIYNDYNGSIATANLADDAVATAKIAASAVTTAKIADANVTTAKLADANVTSEKLNATIACKAYRNAALTLANTGPIKIAFDAELYDLGNNFSIATGTFTAPVTGYYQVNASLGISNLDAAGDALLTYIYVNGAVYSSTRTTVGVAATADPQTTISDLVQATATQTIEIYGQHTSATTPESMQVGSDKTYVSIYFVGV